MARPDDPGGAQRSAAEHENRQVPGGPGWAEHHRLAFVDANHGRAVAMQVGIGAKLNGAAGPVACFHTVVFEPGGLPIVIVDDDIPVPAQRWELRTSGLWADNICETPYRHWSYGLEAFGLAIDDPSEMIGRGFGQRVPLGWELDFEGPPARIDHLHDVDASAYSQPGRVDGLLLFGDGSHEVAGAAVRQHWWGRSSSAPHPWLDAAVATALAGPDPADPVDPVLLPVPGATWAVGFSPEAGLTSRTRPLAGPPAGS